MLFIVRELKLVPGLVEQAPGSSRRAARLRGAAGAPVGGGCAAGGLRTAPGRRRRWCVCASRRGPHGRMRTAAECRGQRESHMPPPLPHEELAGGVIRSVDVLVAVHARPAEHPIALVHRDGVVVVDRRRMFASRCDNADTASASARRACGRSTSRADRGTWCSSHGPARAPTASGRASRRDRCCRVR